MHFHQSRNALSAGGTFAGNYYINGDCTTSAVPFSYTTGVPLCAQSTKGLFPLIPTPNYKPPVGGGGVIHVAKWKPGIGGGYFLERAFIWVRGGGVTTLSMLMQISDNDRWIGSAFRGATAFCPISICLKVI